MRYLILLGGLALAACSSPSENKNQSVRTDSLSAVRGCASPEVMDKLWYSSGKKAPLLSGLEGISFPVSTQNAEAKRYFDQGLMLSFGFNHAEAARSFYEAARLDSTFAMAWWGFAYVLGPNYNGGMEKDNFRRAFDAVQKAKAHSGNATQKEKDLIDALTTRYSNDTTNPRPVLDSTYAAVLRKVYKKYPEDATIASLFAESLMDLHPWNLWKKDGSVQPWTKEIVSVLEKGLKTEPKHPGANHFYIHAMEMSQTAEKAMPSADLLRDLVPGSGHLVHMPSHTYIRTGRYHDGVVANVKASEVDSLYMEACHAQGAYPLAYYPHNLHFVAACATLSGESRLAMEGANATSRHAHKKLYRDPAWATLQHYYTIPWYVQVKLGLWKDILSSKAPDKDLAYPSVVWHYAQGMALLSKDKPAEARKQLAEMKIRMKEEGLKKLTLWGINNILDLCVIASKTLEGEILAKEKNYAKAIVLLKESVKKEDALNYDEPPDWFFSVRHHLGAVLLEAGQYQEAVRVYNEDLKTFRENGWALAGLMKAWEKLGDSKKRAETKLRFDAAWKHADFQINGSRIL